jgi:hypothetical protein
MSARFQNEIAISLAAAAQMLGGEVHHDQIICPGPGHSAADRSLSVHFDVRAPDGFLVHSFSSADFRKCKDYVRRRLGLANEERCSIQLTTPADRRRPAKSDSEKVKWLWSQRAPIAGTIAETYLRSARAYGGAIQSTVGFLRVSEKYPPALIAAYGIAVEREPGVLAIPENGVVGVHLCKLKPDGSDRLRDDPKCKITIGKGVTAPIVLAPPNDLLGLVITEGVEDALTAHEATGLGAWAAGGASRMSALADLIPSYIECVTILVDEDAAGRINSNKLADRLRNRDLEVRLTHRRGLS